MFKWHNTHIRLIKFGTSTLTTTTTSSWTQLTVMSRIQIPIICPSKWWLCIRKMKTKNCNISRHECVCFNLIAACMHFEINKHTQHKLQIIVSNFPLSNRCDTSNYRPKRASLGHWPIYTSYKKKQTKRSSESSTNNLASFFLWNLHLVTHSRDD